MRHVAFKNQINNTIKIWRKLKHLIGVGSFPEWTRPRERETVG